MTDISRRMFNRGALAGLGGAVLAGATGGLVREAHAEDTINFQTVWLNDPDGVTNYYAELGPGSRTARTPAQAGN